MVADSSVEKEGEGYQMGTQTRADLVDRLMGLLREKKVLEGRYVESLSPGSQKPTE